MSCIRVEGSVRLLVVASPSGGRVSIGALQATPPDVLANPGLLDEVVSLGANTPQYPAPGPSRTELLATVATR